MAKIAGGRLAAAVSDAGGLGFVGAGYGDPAWLDEQMALAGDARVGIGLITWNMAEDAVEVALSYRPASVWLSFGDPTPHIPAIHKAGATAVCQVATADEAIQAASAGADVIVAQGSESGGHGRHVQPLSALVPEIAKCCADTPLVAAGGISGPSDLTRVEALGAAGVALGTALYATDEALDVDEAKEAIVNAQAGDTVFGTVYDLVRGPEWPAGYGGRSIRTELATTWDGREAELRANLDPVRDDYQRAVAERDMSVRVVWAGEGVGSIGAVRSAADVVRSFDTIAS